MSKIVSGNTLQGFLQEVIDEAMKSKLYSNSLQEKEKQQATSGNSGSSDNSDQSGGVDLFSGDDGGSEDTAGDDNSATSKTGDDDAETMKKGDIKVEDVVEKLNTIRSGKSFKDDAIKGSMTEYIESLSTAERTALFAFLKGIAQIVTGEISAKQATEPKSNPADIKMQKGDSKQHKTIKPNVIKKAAAPEQGQSKKGSEDTSAPVSTNPITPKKR